MEKFLTPPALARQLGVAEATVYRWIKAGTIPQPTISLGGARGYTSQQVAAVREWYDRRGHSSASTEAGA